MSPSDSQPADRLLTALVEVTQAFAHSATVASGSQRLLEVLRRQHAVLQARVWLAEQPGDPLRLAASIAAAGERRAKLDPPSPITLRVFESGRPVVVPDTAREPLLAPTRRPDRGRARALVSVPVPVGRETAGVLELELAHRPDRAYDVALRFFKVASAILGQALRGERRLDEERGRLLAENTHLREELREKYDFSRIIGTSGPMRAVYEQIAQVARTNTTVLIRGESGTGKELIAHAIHFNSLRAKKPFVKVSCSALPETLIESELFGYEKGAFTGAQGRKAGRFELAEGGTLFLDEIGDINLSTQVKLLRVIQEREFERVGGVEAVKVNVRLVAATNKNLEEAIARGIFREDLHYRLNVFTIFVPPLRERRPDVMLLADHFVQKYAAEHGKHIKRLSTPAIDMLMSYHWPGNVRELENTIERAVVVCEGSVIHGHHLPPALQTAEATGTVPQLSLADAVSAFEKDLLLDALKSTQGNRARAAKLLQSTERIIRYKVKQHHIDVGRFRP
ncbi:MAG: sigma 54-interacting transcriptional regulator [Acidobacteria bacterium]|nr:sigma 54-interacting transcriptional regulator [Acidobacteriota bacterium]